MGIVVWVVGNVCYAKDEIVRGWHTTIPKGTKGTIRSIWQEVGTPAAFVDFELPTGDKRVSVGFDEIEPQRSEVFLPINPIGLHVSGYQSGAVLRIDTDGTQSLVPAMRWPDGRVELVEQSIEDPPPSSEDGSDTEFTDRDLIVIAHGLGAMVDQIESHGRDNIFGDQITLAEIETLAAKLKSMRGNP